jgi:two-component system chemotaxis response regulator CheY
MNDRKVLVVDDSALMRRSLRQIFEPEGWEVLEADNGLAAIEHFFVERPSLVMLDLVMRGMYGLEVLGKLRQIDPQARVIVVSADVQSSSHAMARENGASGFVIKPFNREQILTAVSAALEEKSW